MNNIAIRADNLSKQYKIGETNNRFATLSEQLTHTFTRSFHRISALFGRNGFKCPSLNHRSLSFDSPHSTLDSSTFWALKDISFEVKQGDVLGIIGKNGAGKSTLLKILSRITEPTSGRAEIYGKIASLLEVGTGFHPELTGRDNIYLNGAILGMRKAEINRKFDEIVAFAEIEKFIDTPVKRYSSGMYVRLAFAVAAHLEPDILLIDEVLAVGDAAFQRKCLARMNNVAKEGRTVLFVSHNLFAVGQLCSNSLVLDNGLITFHGETTAAINYYFQTQINQQPIYLATNPVGRRYISKASLVNDDHEVSGCIKSGDDLWIEICFINENEAFQAAMGISIESQNMVRLIADFTLNKNQPFDCCTGMNTYRCRIPNLPLNHGIYFVTVAVHDWNTGIVIDRQDQCFNFEMVDSEREFGSTASQGQNGFVRCQCFWERT